MKCPIISFHFPLIQEGEHEKELNFVKSILEEINVRLEEIQPGTFTLRNITKSINQIWIASRPPIQDSLFYPNFLESKEAKELNSVNTKLETEARNYLLIEVEGGKLLKSFIS